MKIKEKLKKVIVAAGLFITGVLTATFFSRKEKKEEELENEKENIRKKIQETPADVVIADSDNQQDILAGITAEQEEFRRRVRDSFNKKL